MSLLDVLRSGVAIADSVTKPLQATITLQRFIEGDGIGTRSYIPPIPLTAIVEWKQRSVKTRSGELSLSTATILFLNAAELLAATPATVGALVEGEVDDNDIITLADGRSLPILNVGGFVDAGTTTPVATEVYLG